MLRTLLPRLCSLVREAHQPHTLARLLAPTSDVMSSLTVVNACQEVRITSTVCSLLRQLHCGGAMLAEAADSSEGSKSDAPSRPPPWTPTKDLTKRNFLPRRMGHLLQVSVNCRLFFSMLVWAQCFSGF
jgi:hypothetical protein